MTSVAEILARRVTTLPGTVEPRDPSVDVPFGDRVGRCYELAARFLAEVSGAELVHGTIQGHGKPPIEHAWVEVPDGSVFEPTSGHRMTTVEFADYFRPVPRVRYSRERAYAAMLAHETYGPWDDETGDPR